MRRRLSSRRRLWLRRWRCSSRALRTSRMGPMHIARRVDHDHSILRSFLRAQLGTDLSSEIFQRDDGSVDLNPGGPDWLRRMVGGERI